MMDEDDGDDGEGEFSPFEDEETYRQDGVLNIPKILKCGNGETVVGIIVNETLMYIELKWPMLVTTTNIKVEDGVYPMMLLTRYAPGVFENFVTFNKDQLIWWNDTDETVDEFYQAQLPKLYKDAKQKLITDQRKIYPSDMDEELEKLVTKSTVGKPARNLAHMIDLMTGITKKPTTPPEDG